MSHVSPSLRIKILKFGYSVGLTSICWDESTGKLKLTATKYRCGWIFIENILLILYQIFLVYQSSIRQLGNRFTDSDLLLIRYNTALWLYLNVNNIGDKWATDYVKVMNGLGTMKAKFGGKFINSSCGHLEPQGTCNN